MTDTNDNGTDRRGVLNPKRRTVLLAMGSMSLAGCADTQDNATQNSEGTVTVDTQNAERVPADEIGSENTGGDGDDGVETTTDDDNDDDALDEDSETNAEDEDEDEDEDETDTSEDEEEEDDDSGEDEENEDEEEEEEEDDEWSVEEIVAKHTAALSEVSYSADISLQGEDSPSDVTNTLVYTETQVADSREVTIRQESTRDDGVSYIKHNYGMSGDDVEVEFDDGDRAAGDLYDGETPDSSPVVITGGGLLRQLVAGASLSATRLPEDQSGTTGEYELTGHDSLNVTGGSLIINQANIVESFTMDWTDANGVPRTVSIAVSDMY